MKKILLFLIEWYQKMPFSSHKMCRFTPTCSEYAKDAIIEYGSLKGSFLAMKRILRCNPLSTTVYDPIPVKENKK